VTNLLIDLACITILDNHYNRLVCQLLFLLVRVRVSGCVKVDAKSHESTNQQPITIDALQWQLSLSFARTF
jgi:hypothetical protein